MSRPLYVVAAQSVPHPIDAPLDGFAAEVSGLVQGLPDAQIVVYPELHLHGTPEPSALHNDQLRASAEPLDGPRVKLLRQLAGDLKVWLLPGTVCERGEGGEIFNTAVALSPEGELAASYRKIFPWRPYEPYDPGGAFVTFELPGIGRAGLSICYDAWFPEVTRHLAWMGAEVVFNLVKTTTIDRAQELVLARANAIVNQIFMVSVNVAGPIGQGQSLIVDPEGLVRASAASENPGVLTDVVDLDQVEKVRRFGTAGLTRPWDQFREGDEPIELPLYGGRMDPARWHPAG